MLAIETLAQAASSIAVLFGLGVATGLVPRFGPGRAIALGLKSRFSSAGTPSQRVKDVTCLQRMMKTQTDNRE